MTSIEKIELLKTTIIKLYEKEGRSILYISNILDVNRKNLSLKIKEWNLVHPDVKHLSPSNEKFLHKHEDFIVSRLNADIPIADIAKEIGCGTSRIYHSFLHNSKKIENAYNEYIQRLEKKKQNDMEAAKEKSSFNYIIIDDTWKQIKGFSNYYASKDGRIAKYIKTYNSYIEISQTPNKNNGRLYARLVNDSGNSKNLNVARVIGHTFLSTHSEVNNTINHKDGDVSNNNVDNLEWVSQSVNNEHSYRELNRTKVNYKKYIFTKILYKGKYEFKTVAAFAKFIGKSETQTRRYLDNPSKYDIILIK